MSNALKDLLKISKLSEENAMLHDIQKLLNTMKKCKSPRETTFKRHLGKCTYPTKGQRKKKTNSQRTGSYHNFIDPFFHFLVSICMETILALYLIFSFQEP